MMKPLTEVRLLKVKAGKPPRLVYKAAWWGLRDGVRRRFTETIGPVRTTRHKDAKLYCANKQDAINGGRISADRLGRMSLADFLERDREAAAMDLKAASLRDLKIAGRHALKALGEDFNVQKVDAAAVVRIRQHLQAKNLAPVTVLKQLSYLQGAFRRGVDLGIIHANPFSKMKRPKFQTPRPKVFALAEVDAMLGVCRDRGDLWWEAFIRLGVTSGCRRGEMVHLHWSSIDWDESTVTINPQRGGTFTVGDDSYPLLAWESKDYETRVIPLPAETLEFLRPLKVKAGASPYVFIDLGRLRAIASHLKADGTLDPNYPVIPNLNLHFGVIQGQAKDRLTHQGQKVDWPARSLKHLRSTYASRISEHVSPFQLKNLLGHSSVTTSERHYVAAAGDLGRKVQAAFGAKAEAS